MESPFSAKKHTNVTINMDDQSQTAEQNAVQYVKAHARLFQRLKGASRILLYMNLYVEMLLTTGHHES